MKQNKGFTLIELLIVIGIIGFLAAAILVAVDPVKRIQDARNAKRWAEINAMLNAILTKQVDDKAVFNGRDSAPIITSNAYSQVIVYNDAAIDCSAAATKPNCPGQTLTTTADKTCVANLGNVMVGTATSAGTAVTGTGTAFTTEAAVGDTIASAAGSECVVSAITSATAITCSVAPNPVFAGAVTNITRSIVPLYIAEIPVDPLGAGTIATATYLPLGDKNTGYYIHRTNGNRLEIGACYADQSATIKVKR
jgi:prepilin-type N-terminal cleavage/methylation domain-containing protein